MFKISFRVEEFVKCHMSMRSWVWIPSNHWESWASVAIAALETQRQREHPHGLLASELNWISHLQVQWAKVSENKLGGDWGRHLASISGLHTCTNIPVHMYTSMYQVPHICICTHKYYDDLLVYPKYDKKYVWEKKFFFRCDK